ncbi:MAG: Lrp/AsnC family transcriptional regulator [Thermoplasmata archaeon]|nr:Lrp/AsnC family transcriptional regulator [Thermoplasmata archaeon]
MDDRDRKILEILLKDSRTSYSDIAKLLGISDTAVRKRIKNLEDMGIIRGYTISVDPHQIGYKCIAIVGIDTEADKFYKIAQKLKEMDFVKCLDITVGENMIVAEIWAEDGEALAHILSEKIGKMEGIRRIKSSVVLQKLKG